MAQSNSWSTCYDIASGQRALDYPDTFVGVHGSHNAPPPEVGLIRGSFHSVRRRQAPRSDR